MKGDKNRQAEAEHKDGDEEVAVGENGFRTFGLVHRVLLRTALDDSRSMRCQHLRMLPSQSSDSDVVVTTGGPDEDSRRYDTE